MPYIRKTKDKIRNNKQKKLIISRLMAISLKVDDYVYKKKPISENDAEQYIEEVSSYKIFCSKDERPLQAFIKQESWVCENTSEDKFEGGAPRRRPAYRVIEKLTRIMKLVIAEQQIMNDDNYSGVNYVTNDKSPDYSPIARVYSTADDATTYLTQVNDEVLDLVKISEKNAVPPKSIKHNNHCFNHTSRMYLIPEENHTKITEIDVDENKNSRNGDIINLFNSEKSYLGDSQIQGYIDEVNAVVEIHKAISSLSINKTQDPIQEIGDDDGNSQSILNNFETIGINKGQDASQNNDKSIFNISALVATNETKIDKRTMNNTKMAIFHRNITNELPKVTAASVKKCNVKESKIQAINKPRVDASDFAISDLDKVKKTNPDEPIPITKKLVKNMKVPNAMVLKKDSRTLENKENTCTRKQKKCNKSKVTKPKPIEIKGNNINPPNKNVTITKKQRQRKNKSQELIDMKDTLKRDAIQCNDNNITSHLIPSWPNSEAVSNSITNEIPIYNNNTVNDLSWLENIRFVREINSDEYQHANIEESFWDSYNLPIDWDEQNFI